MLAVDRGLTEVYEDCAYVAALDIAFANTGVVVAEYLRPAGEWEICYVNTISTQKEAKRRGTYVVEDDLRRIKEMGRELFLILNHYPIKLIVTEFPFSAGQGRNAAHGMGVAKGVVAALAGTMDIEIDNFLPQDTKKTMTGTKSASKERMILAAAELYPEIFKEDCFHSKRSSSGYSGFVEHIADAIAAFETAKISSRLLPLIVS